MKVINGAHGIRADLRTEEAERIQYTREAIKQAYKPEWALIFKRQCAKVAAVKAQTTTAPRWLSAMLSGRAGD